MKAREIAGQRFGRLVAISRDGSMQGHAIWICVCDCGVKTRSSANNLTQGTAKSCGCGKTKHGHTVGGEFSRTYRTWRKMLDRCLNTKHVSYHRYGGRGITICNEWLKFDTFMADMGVRPDGMTLDRADNESGYNKANCRWATKEQQMRNTRSNHYICVGEVTMLLVDWGRELGINACMISTRVRRRKETHEEAVMYFISKRRSK